MNVVALLLLALAASSAHSSPLNFGIGSHLSDAWNTLKGLASETWSYLEGKLQVAGDALAKNTFLNNIKKLIEDKVHSVGGVTIDILSDAAGYALSLASGNSILSSDVAGRIAATFGFKAPSGAQPLQLSEIDGLPIGGDPAAAAAFRTSLKALILAKANGKPQLNLIAGVVDKVLDLLTSNAILTVKGATALKDYLSLGSLVKDFEASVDTILQILADLQAGITGTVEAVSRFLRGLYDQIKAKLAAGNQLTVGVLSKAIADILDLAASNDIVSADAGNRIKATFGIEASGASPLTAADIDSLFINGSDSAAAEFRTTLKSLLQLKEAGATASIPLLAGVQNSLLNLLVSNAIIKLQAALSIKQHLGLAPLQAALDVASRLVSDLQSQVAGDASAASTFFDNVVTDIQAKLAANGKLTEALLEQVVQHTLNLAVGNEIFSQDVAAQLAASFGIGPSTGVQPLKISDIDALVINGDAKAAAQFKGTLKGLLQLQATGGAERPTILAGFNTALLNNLTANKVIEIAAAIGLKALFGTA